MTPRPDAPAGDRFGQDEKVLKWTALAVCALALAGYGASVFNRYLVNDDYQLLYTAWMQSIGLRPGADFAVYSTHVLVDLLAPLFSCCGQTLLPLYLGRLFMLGALGLVAYLAFRLCRTMQFGVASYFAPVLILCNTIMFHRALDLRPDLLTTLGWLALIYLLARRPLPNCRAAFWLGLILGLVLVNRFKGSLIGLVVGPMLVHDIVAYVPKGKRLLAVLGRGAALGAGVAVPCLLYLGYLAASGQSAAFVETAALTGQIANSAWPLAPVVWGRTFLAALKYEAPFLACALLGIIFIQRTSAWAKPRHRFLLLLLLLTAASSVLLNPAYYLYNLTTLLPLLAPFAALGLGVLLSFLQDTVASARRQVVVAACLLALPLAIHLPFAVPLAFSSTNASQVRLQRFLFEYTAPADPVFALEGIGLFRPSNYTWRMPEVVRPYYESGGFDLATELRAAPPEVVITSYRVPKWLTLKDADFLKAHYLRLKGEVFVPGAMLDGATKGETSVEILRSGRYELLADRPEACLIDGRVVTGQTPLLLEKGTHRLSATGGLRCAIRKWYPPAALELLPTPGIPLLLSPNRIGLVDGAAGKASGGAADEAGLEEIDWSSLGLP